MEYLVLLVLSRVAFGCLLYHYHWGHDFTYHIVSSARIGPLQASFKNGIFFSCSSSFCPPPPPSQYSVRPADPSTPLSLLFGLAHRNLNDAESLFEQVSSPLHQNYGQYLTADTWKAMFSPHEAQLAVLHHHLHSSFQQRPRISLTGDWAKLGPCSVADIERVYNTTVVQYGTQPDEGGGGGGDDDATIAYKLSTPMHMPQEVREMIEFVNLAAPLHSYSQHTHKKRQEHLHKEQRQHQPFPHRRASAETDGFNFPHHLSPASQFDVAPIVNPNTFIGGDGFVSLSFMPYCLNGDANTNGLKEDRFVCGNGRKKEQVNNKRAQIDKHLKEGKGCKEDEFCPAFISPPPPLSFSTTPPDVTQTYIVGFEVILHQPETEVTKIVEIASEFPVLWSRTTSCEHIPCVEFNTTIGDVPNYGQTWVSIRSLFSNGYRSAFSPYEEVHPVWPLPYVTPDALASLYVLPRNLPVRFNRSSIAVAEFLEQYFSQKDLDEFFRLTGVPKQSPPLVKGPNDQMVGRVNGTEAQLDIQYIMGLASNVTTWFWSIPGRNAHTGQEPFLEWLFEISDTPDATIPLVHSVSYGDDEHDMEVWYAKRLNVEFMKMGLRGLTVLVSSGDDGAAGIRARTDATACRRNNPELPAALPFVTAVGGTQLARNSALVCGARLSESARIQCHYDREKACMADTGGGITTGGGFSRYFKRPWYQEKMVSHYLDYADQPLPASPNYFNATGRAYPDISAYANNFLVLMDNQFELIHGTSASTPVVAALVAHMNDIRLRRGEPPVGFLNPLLYYWAEFHPEAFNDILVGNNKCGISPYKCCKEGFYASRGWDPLTGIGTPRFNVFAELLQSPVHPFSHPISAAHGLPREAQGTNKSAEAMMGEVQRNRDFRQTLEMLAMACIAGLVGFLLTTLWKQYLQPKFIAGYSSATTRSPARARPGERSPISEILLTNLHNPYSS
eukprot:GHVS01074357.1.p1 GENE.GHVS01074357.1~~GHVS01074357.1.p1  ORF type:complete len:955 (-),score=114.60 GHVS01074357.1:449-3313(-)